MSGSSGREAAPLSYTSLIYTLPSVPQAMELVGTNPMRGLRNVKVLEGMSFWGITY